MLLEEARVRSIFDLASLRVYGLWKLPNEYWRAAVPDDWDDKSQVDVYLKYAKIREISPWWLVKTDLGLIKIGWRKRVMAIDWSDTGIRQVVTDDDVTKSHSGVHAWTELKAIEYLMTFRKIANAKMGVAG